jgi:hypothetical protein
VNGVPPHVFGERDALEVCEREVCAVAVLENDDVAGRNASVFSFPDANVLEFPAEPAEPRPSGFRDLPLVIAIPMAAIDAHQSPDGHRGVRHLAFFELRLLHAAAADGIARPPQALIRRHVAFPKTMRKTIRMIAPKPVRLRAGEILWGLFQAEFGRALRHAPLPTAEQFRHFLCRPMRKFTAKDFVLGRGPETPRRQNVTAPGHVAASTVAGARCASGSSQGWRPRYVRSWQFS